MFQNIGFTEILLIAIVGLLLFGPQKLPEFGRALGRTIHEFKKGARELLSVEPEAAAKPAAAERKQETAQPVTTEREQGTGASAGGEQREAADERGVAKHAGAERKQETAPSEAAERTAADPLGVSVATETAELLAASGQSVGTVQQVEAHGSGHSASQLTHVTVQPLASDRHLQASVHGPSQAAAAGSTQVSSHSDTESLQGTPELTVQNLRPDPVVKDTSGPSRNPKRLPD
ncbi:twin-arginine translocase TatA/TatE family subunit [Paenibacillus hexagrammi]|uniref:twin-arginine translocase TatA/TatE family subunit n=1 Tax=Paenibacillus hexagrammi TaxID=2908839 RepID=UPI002882E4D5|nr:twin-arginine translocase TatA/TatE family subunit [Paenibacillus sp. YPD9-1]